MRTISGIKFLMAEITTLEQINTKAVARQGAAKPFTQRKQFVLPGVGEVGRLCGAEPAHQRAGVFLFSIAEGEEGGGVEGEVVHG